jgi:hypothetical protein
MVWGDENALAAKRLGIASDANAKEDTKSVRKNPKSISTPLPASVGVT